MELIKSTAEVDQGYISLSTCLLKADAKHKDILYIQASNEMEDVQGDTMLQKALEDQRENFLKKGVLSWDHQHKINKDPNFICGEPVDVSFGANNTTLVKGKMYMKNKYAQGVMAMAKSNSTRLGASVGGYITKRIQKVDALTKSIRKFITGVLWDEVALTYKPVNEGTMGNVSIMPFEEFAKSFVERDTELWKSLMAGAGTDSANMTGGRALIAESLQGGQKSVVSLEERLSTVLKNVKSGKVKNFKDFDSLLIKQDLAPHRNKLMTLIIKNNTKLRSL